MFDTPQNQTVPSRPLDRSLGSHASNDSSSTSNDSRPTTDVAQHLSPILPTYASTNPLKDPSTPAFGLPDILSVAQGFLNHYHANAREPSLHPHLSKILNSVLSHLPSAFRATSPQLAMETTNVDISVLPPLSGAKEFERTMMSLTTRGLYNLGRKPTDPPSQHGISDPDFAMYASTCAPNAVAPSSRSSSQRSTPSETTSHKRTRTSLFEARRVAAENKSIMISMVGEYKRKHCRKCLAQLLAYGSSSYEMFGTRLGLLGCKWFFSRIIILDATTFLIETRNRKLQGKTKAFRDFARIFGLGSMGFSLACKGSLGEDVEERSLVRLLNFSHTAASIAARLPLGPVPPLEQIRSIGDSALVSIRQDIARASATVSVAEARDFVFIPAIARDNLKPVYRVKYPNLPEIEDSDDVAEVPSDKDDDEQGGSGDKQEADGQPDHGDDDQSYNGPSHTGHQGGDDGRPFDGASQEADDRPEDEDDLERKDCDADDDDNSDSEDSDFSLDYGRNEDPVSSMLKAQSLYASPLWRALEENMTVVWCSSDEMDGAVQRLAASISERATDDANGLDQPLRHVNHDGVQTLSKIEPRHDHNFLDEHRRQATEAQRMYT